MTECKKYIQLCFHSRRKILNLFVKRDLKSFTSFTKLRYPGPGG